MRKAREVYPELGKSLKVYPEDIAGMLGLPSVGEIFYVDPSVTTSGSGKTRQEALKTVAEAYALLTADQDDVVVICGSSSTGRTSESAAINWAKRRTHIVGNGPLRKINPRNGISFGASVVSPCFTVSATNCSFTNISIAQFNDVNVLVEITADYNTFDHVHFQGIANDTTGDDTAARCVLITGAGELIFKSCTIGLDTVARSVANASLEVTGSCARNQFIDCDFPIWADNSGALIVIATTGNCTERFLKFDHCMFFNPATIGGATNITKIMDTGAGNGVILLDACGMIGATDWCDTFTTVYSINTPTVPTQATAGFMQVLA